MRFRSLIWTFVLLATTGSVLAQQPLKPQTNSPASKLTALGSGTSDASGKIPTDEEIAAFVVEYKATENSNESLSLHARMGPAKKNPNEKKKATNLNQKVAYQLTVDLVKTKTVNSKKTAVRDTSGKCNVAILDSKGNVVKKSSENLIKLCAS